MSLLPYCETPLIFDYKENVSKSTAKMLNERRHEAIVLNNGRYEGIVFARDLTKRKINNPDKTAIGKYASKINPISFEYPIEEVINMMLINDYKSMPVKRGDDFFVLTRIGILKSMKNAVSFRSKKLRDIMKFPYSVSYNDTISTAMSVLRQTGVSRLPVVSKTGGIDGLIDAVDLLEANIGAKRMQKGERIGEKTKKREALISSLIKTTPIVLTPTDTVKRAVEEMIGKNTPTVLVEDKKTLAGIVTPKMILKLLGKELSGVLVTLSGIKDEDPFIKSVVDEEVSNEVRKLNKIIGIEHLIVHIDKHHKTGDRFKYTVKARMMTERGMFFADDFAWDITKAIRGMLHKLEKELIKKKSKIC
ncbi:MAG: CBS domain-containing protein [Nanoarchaeota archaeon]